MLLAPSRTKYRKQHRGRMRGKAYRGNTIAFGEFALQALEPVWLEARQIEAARIAMTRFIKRGGKVWIRVFPDKPVERQACRDPHGFWQRRARPLGCRGQARAHSVRAWRRPRGHCQRGHAPGIEQAADSRPNSSSGRRRKVSKLNDRRREIRAMNQQDAQHELTTCGVIFFNCA